MHSTECVGGTMKKSFLIMITLVCCLALAAGILTACNSNEGTQTGGQNSGWSSSSDGVISIAGGTIDGEEIFMLVESSVDSVSLASRVKCAEGMIWRLYHDNLGQQEIPTKIAAGNNGRLNNGNNVFYIVVTSTDATRVSVYSLTIHRSYAASIRFYDGAALVYTDTAYTGYEYVVDYTPDIPGCVFHYWETADGDECSSIMLWGSVSLYANKTANVYKATLSSGYDDSVDSKILNITYGEAFYFPVPQRVGHSFRGWYVGDEQLTSSDGRSLDVWEYTSDQTVTAKWQINSYAVALQTNISGAGELLGSGNYGYASTVNIEAEPYLGYEFAGWYDGDKLVSSQSSYTFSLPASGVTYTAKFAVRDEMSNFAFTSTFDECTITGVKDKSVTDITIPDYVTSIYSSAFSECNNIISATMPTFAIGYIPQDSLQTVVLTSGEFIGDSAFYGCSGLTSITIGNSVTSIGDSAFNGCTGLTSITIPDSVTSIGDYAFYVCSGLTSVTIPNSVTSIGMGAFEGCDSLESIKIPFVGATKEGTSGTHFGYIFGASSSGYNENYVPTSLKEVVITGGTSILNSAFEGCSGLTSVTIPDSVTSIEESAFEGCSKITFATMPTLAIDYIPQNSLQTVVLTSGESIGDYAFYNCSSLTSVTLPDSVTSIGDYAFMGCHKLAEVYNKSSLDITTANSENGYVAYYAKNVYTEEGGSWFTDTADGFRFFYDGTDGYLMGYYGEETAITLPDGFTAYDGTEVTEYAIYDYAFYSCDGLTSVTIPDSVTSIGDYAFYVCSGLTSVTIPNSVTSIGMGAFMVCSGLTSVTIGNGVTSIGNHAFYECSSLTSVTIPDSVTSIGDHAFRYCDSLTSVYISDIAAWCGIDFGGSSANPLSYAHNLYLNGKLVTDLTIPDSVTSIGSYAFYGCSSLTSITIPDSVTSIGSYAFYGCTGLTSVTIGNGVTSIGSMVFAYCYELLSVTFEGTKADWNAITKEDSWKNNSLLTEVVCSDGKVSV